MAAGASACLIFIFSFIAFLSAFFSAFYFAFYFAFFSHTVLYYPHYSVECMKRKQKPHAKYQPRLYRPRILCVQYYCRRKNEASDIQKQYRYDTSVCIASDIAAFDLSDRLCRFAAAFLMSFHCSATFLQIIIYTKSGYIYYTETV